MKLMKHCLEHKKTTKVKYFLNKKLILFKNNKIKIS
jgi:hypothetical protein